MQIVFHPDAQEELNFSINYYEDNESSLGHQFAIEVFYAVERIKANPLLWPLLNQGVRRCLIHRFPYGVIYSFDDTQSTILILAVMHLHRQPGYWSERA
ncbi:plasmid stabilization system family protein [Synechococcus sp. RS9909]|uniref:type II toxin-antitoxin system RelE/ParE family toxin n=1 Tax=unclassified Synechococcus TaxID=2626047 RepID=UPI000068F5A6|nr:MULTISPECIES: type II toxin-antitoxin system RelE/ParE family toxin [unclassified Synechococcus]EAQ69987.1 Plasmid stabilization system protein [Synechococcus sp. RS9917]QNI79745.1 plasmid stabilization system family protein [Synechococcus sp. RS9909]